jgi:cardiolipin synthase A/B
MPNSLAAMPRLIFAGLAIVLLAACGTPSASNRHSVSGGPVASVVSDQLPHLSKALPPGVVPAHLYVEPEAGVKPLVSLLDHATHSIFVETYFLSDRSVIDALERAEAQGVKVNVLLDGNPLGLESYARRTYDELTAADIPTRWTASTFEFTHAKFMVIDDREAIISTANFSASAFESNREVLAIDKGGAEVRDLSNLFRDDWNRTAFALHDPELIISPINARQDLTRLISHARHTIDIYDEEMEDPALETLLTRMAKAGVRVRVLLPTGAASGSHRPPASLLAAVQVRELSSPYVHAKVIMIDGGESYIGSENLSSTSLDKNREVGVFLRGPLTLVQTDFNADWSRGKSPS